jgi:hypothetical protein
MSLSAFEQALADSGSVASFLGLAASIFAWIAATGAKKAAREAANAVRVRNLAHSFSRWAMDARDLLKAVRELHFKDAQWAATDLLGALSHNKGWQSELRQSATDAEEIVLLLDFVNNYLSDEEIFSDMRDRLVVNCQAIYKKLNEVAGAIDAQVEGL